MTDSLN